MTAEIQKVISLKNFFHIIHSNNKSITYSYKKASEILLQNIQSEWLQFINAKTCHHIPVFLNKLEINKVDKNKTFGYIIQSLPLRYQKCVMEYNLDYTDTKTTTELCLDIILPAPDVMQYFMKWQRYRKYWWSSITTTPSLISISDVKHTGSTANVNIVANFNWGSRIVETVFTNTDGDVGKCHLICKMSLDGALLTLLLDAINNSMNEECLRFNITMAPYKIALALNCKESKDFDALKDLCTLIMHKLEIGNISTRCPDVLLPLEVQLKENFRVGAPYTAIISANTLSNGIFKLLNSNTMLKEHLHITDFQSYASLLCGK